jgi:trans-AT polyketide synthase, acyltransferase and oxidoreductase domains
VFAKVSRTEVAERFMRPAPKEMIDALVAKGVLTEAQAVLAAQMPIANDVTAEADSGGHTDHRPLPVLLPELLALRDRVVADEGYAARGIDIRVGAAGGLGTPKALWGAFAMGADYVLTGSVNQATKEAGTSDAVKEMLGEASFTDVATGPAPDMFEIGAKVQVLSRGSMYAQRAQRLYELYKQYGDIDALPEKERERVEKQMFKRPLDEVWAETKAYWDARDPAQVEKAERDPRHKMSLTFRWYLGFTSRWARMGEEDRKRDYQIWCGPAMGGYNRWAADNGQAAVMDRTIASVAEGLLVGAVVESRRFAVKMALGADR